MIKHIIRTILTITVACSTESVCHAGITVVNDRVTEATLANGTTQYHVQFVNASYDSLNYYNNQAIMPWLNDGPLAIALALELSNKLNEYEGVAPQLDPLAHYLFPYSNATWVSPFVFSYKAFDQDPWAYSFELSLPDVAYTTDPVFHYAILGTGGISSVPEPSTAIAMGLLGIVGFAGNRRRRRQVSVA